MDTPTHLDETQPPRRSPATAIADRDDRPESIGPYPVVGELGRGGMGVVYLAEDATLGRPIAIKVLPAQLADPEHASWLEREARLLASVIHPNVATIHSFERTDDTSFLTMEFVPGDTLAELLVNQALRPRHAVAIAAQIAAALEAMHAKSVVHGDLTPPNIKLMPDGRVKVLDFGLARMRTSRPGDPTESAGDAFCGTPGYMSPEQLGGADIDERTDIWTFGCVVYECLTGTRAFGGDTTSERMRRSCENEPDWSLVPSRVPEPVRELVRRCLAKEPFDRVPSMSNARKLLDSFVDPDRQGVAAQAGPPPSNLPHHLPSFVGRGALLGNLQTLVRKHRLVTLTGAGGSGKTRLALEVASTSAIARLARDGLWLVELAPITVGTHVPRAIAQALALHVQADRSLVDTIIDAVSGKSILLVLDNCEHLVDDCGALVERLLEATVDLRLLVTSRERLGVAGEYVCPVPPLNLPDGDQLDGIRAAESVRLFLERAESTAPFELTPARARRIADICRRLDGIPLAIELAAALTGSLSVAEIHDRLADRFALLTGGPSSLPHHQTLRALVDWSYDHLDDAEQTLLRRLAIFAASWHLDAAEAICSDLGEPFLAVHARLIRKSLVDFERNERGGVDDSRYRMSETMRAYARAQLDLSGEHEALQGRLVHYYVALAEESEPHLQSSQQTEWFVRLAREHDNVRLALEHCLEPGVDPELGLRLIGALGRYWMVQGHWTEGRSLCARSLDRAPDGRTAATAKTLNAAGNLAFHQGDYDEARACHRRSLTIRRALGDHQAEAMSLNNLGEVARLEGDVAGARACYLESKAIQERIGDVWGLAVSLNNLGELAQMQGRYDEARAHHERALILWPDIGDCWGTAWSLSNLGFVARRQGNLSDGQAFYERSLQISRDLGDDFGAALSLHALGGVAEQRDERQTALAHFRDGLTLRHRLGDRRGMIESLEAIAALVSAFGDTRRAARLVGAAEAARHALRSATPAIASTAIDVLTADLEERLGTNAFANRRAEGLGMSLDQAVADALSGVRS